MIIKDIHQGDRLLRIKGCIYRFVKVLVDNYMNNSLNLVQLLLLYLAFTLPFISILFKRDNHFPEPISRGTHLVTQSSEASSSPASKPTSASAAD